MYVDSHCHLDLVDLEPYDGDFARMVEANREAGVTRMLCVSIDLETRPDMLRRIEGFADIDWSVGVHPCDPRRRTPEVDELVELAADPRNVAIGETGLDYFRTEGDLEWQRERFRVHVRAARQAGKPLIVHTREAREDTLRILREEGAEAAGGVLHCFTETWEMAEAALDLGFYISFSGIVTFRNAEALREVARRVPLERLLIETDSPYLSPVPHRGRPNEPRRVAQVCECIAGLRGLSTEALAERTAENYRELFRPAA